MPYIPPDYLDNTPDRIRPKRARGTSIFTGASPRTLPGPLPEAAAGI